MKLGKIVGRVVSTVKIETLDELRLLLLQPLNEKLENVGSPIVAGDTISAGQGDLVYYESSKEAGRVLSRTQNPCDAAIMGIVDQMDLIKE